MESSRLPLTALVLLVSLGPLLGPREVPSAVPEPLDRRLEVTRLRAHFDSVDVELRHSNAFHLSPAQRRVRVTLIGWLREAILSTASS